MTVRSKAVQKTEALTFRLYVVTAQAVPYVYQEKGEPVEMMLYTGDIVPADMPTKTTEHMLAGGLIAAYEVPVTTNRTGATAS